MMMDSDVLTENQQVSAGALLRMAREKKGLGLEEVVSKLKLSRRQIEALESDNFAELPGATFVRGFVRNYARVLEIDPDPILSLLECGPATVMPAMGQEPVAEPKVPPLIKLPQRPGGGYPRSRGLPLRWIVGGVVLLLMAGVAVFLAQQSGLEPEVTLAPATQPAPLAEGPASTPAPVPMSEPVVPDAATVAPVGRGVLPEPAMEAAPVAVEPPAAAEAPAAAAEKTDGPAGQLRLAFDGDSWVDIRDADGNKVVAKLYKPGGEETLSGKPPFRLVIGNAAQVKLFYNGQPVDLAAHVKVNVARLKLE